VAGKNQPLNAVSEIFFQNVLPLALKEGYGKVVKPIKRKNTMTKFAMMLMFCAFSVTSVNASDCGSTKTETSSEENTEEVKEEEAPSAK